MKWMRKWGQVLVTVMERDVLGVLCPHHMHNVMFENDKTFDKQSRNEAEPCIPCVSEEIIAEIRGKTA